MVLLGEEGAVGAGQLAAALKACRAAYKKVGEGGAECGGAEVGLGSAIWLGEGGCGGGDSAHGAEGRGAMDGDD